jgi:NAD dependent epimerase/dehydratase family enzyme
MTTQEILKKLEKNDKVAIRGVLKGIYSDRYITCLLSESRPATALFEKVVQKQWENKQEFQELLGVD